MELVKLKAKIYHRECKDLCTCPFCSIPAKDILDENEYALAVRDRCPVSEGHTLIITKRHVDNYFKLSTEEKNGTAALLEKMKNAIDTELNPDGYNIGMNIGEAAGQKIFHVHIHLSHPQNEGGDCQWRSRS